VKGLGMIHASGEYDKLGNYFCQIEELGVVEQFPIRGATRQRTIKLSDYVWESAAEKFAIEQFPVQEFIGNIVWLLLAHPPLGFLCSFPKCFINKPTLNFWDYCKWAEGYARKHYTGDEMDFQPLEVTWSKYTQSDSNGKAKMWFDHSLTKELNCLMKAAMELQILPEEVFKVVWQCIDSRATVEKLIYLMVIAMELPTYPDKAFKATWKRANSKVTIEKLQLIGVASSSKHWEVRVFHL
jgi:hypothetical protein